MGYFVCIGRYDAYRNFAVANPVGANPASTVYNGFKFRDVACPQVGRTRYGFPNMAFDLDVFSIPTTNFEANPGITKHTDALGLIWRWKEGNKPDDHQFTRRPWGKTLDKSRDAWRAGTRTHEKDNGTPTSVNEGFILSSTVYAYKKRGDLG